MMTFLCARGIALDIDLLTFGNALYYLKKCSILFHFLLRAESTTGAPNIRLQLGMFTVYPAVGSVPAGGAVQVTVDMIAENPGFCEEVGANKRGIALFFRKMRNL